MNEDRPVRLSEIELRVADLAAHATAVESLAGTLGLRPQEAADHLAAVYRKLGPPNRPPPARLQPIPVRPEGRLEGF